MLGRGRREYDIQAASFGVLVLNIERMLTMPLHRETKQQKATGQSKGFTLIELLIVIVVLGILAAVVVFALGSVTAKSAKSACTADAKTVETAAAAYEAQQGTTPTQAQLTTGANATLKSWPSNPTHYVIGLGTKAGSPADEVDIALAATPTVWVTYDSEGAGGCNAVI
jgi:prepilin-type N-terminal cleavage/methylation domain-containing protein